MNISADFFKDEEIRQFIISNSQDLGFTSYNETPSTLIDFDELSDFFTALFSLYIEDPSSTISLMEIIEEDWGLFVKRTTLVRSVLSDILRYLEIPLSPETNVRHVDYIEECLNYWRTLKEELKKKKRFLSDISEYGWDTLFDVNSFIDNKTSLYRSRIHYSRTEERPYKKTEMGCPPQNICEISEGRANPRGIPYLYLSKEIETTYYEIRAVFLDYVSVALFKVKENRTLKITDFTKELSPFDNYVEILDFAKGILLRRIISKDLSKPLHRFDSELEYIPTQFICEYIRYICDSDGVQFYSSVKKGGVNLVLFDEKTVCCERVELHQITDLKMNHQIVLY